MNKNLVEHLKNKLNTEIISEAFNNKITPDALATIEHLKINTLPDSDINNFINILNEIDPDMSISWSPGSKLFKIPRQYGGVIKSKIKGTNISTSVNGKGDLDFYINNIKVALEGSGSGEKRIPTNIQEIGTCIAWNAIIDNNLLVNSENIKDSIKELSEDLYDNKGWIHSYYNQIMALKDFLSPISTEFRAVRYDTKLSDDFINEEDIAVAQAHYRFLNRYIKKISEESNDSNIKKDIYDPSDILLYNTKTSDIISKIDSIDNSLSIEEMKDAYLDLYKNKILIGVSLKKSKSSRYQEFNTENKSGNKVSISNAYTVFYGDKGACRTYVKGKFNFSGMNEPATTDKLQTSELILDLRTFGGGQVAIDIRMSPEHPPLGKIPVVIWKSMLGLDKGKNPKLQVVSDAWAQKLLDNPINIDTKTKYQISTDKFELLKHIIMDGAKMGHLVLPFVMVF